MNTKLRFTRQIELSYGMFKMGLSGSGDFRFIESVNEWDIGSCWYFKNYGSGRNIWSGIIFKFLTVIPICF